MHEFQGSAPSARQVKNEFNCVSCGHVIRGLELDQLCPECGTPVMRSVNSAAGGQPTSGWAVASLVMGILAIVSCAGYGMPALLFGPLAIWFGSKAKAAIRDGRASEASRSLATAGLTCGIIGLSLAIPVVVLIMIFLIGGGIFAGF